MVNERLRQAPRKASPRSGTAKTYGKPGFLSINKSFSKRFEFAEKSRRIRFECAQKREEPLQSRLLLV